MCIAAAVVGSIGTPVASASLDELGRPTPETIASIENLVDQEFIPEDTRATIARALGFLTGPDEADPDAPGIPTNGPRIAQFAYPTVMENCIDGDSSAIGTATAVPGPAALPLPGVPAHQTGFVFTALGTGPAAENQARPLTVRWVNISNFRQGETVLRNHGINPDGPTTLNATADTGPGYVLALMEGGVTTQLEEGGTSQCNILPIVGAFQIG